MPPTPWAYAHAVHARLEALPPTHCTASQYFSTILCACAAVALLPTAGDTLRLLLMDAAILGGDVLGGGRSGRRRDL